MLFEKFLVHKLASKQAFNFQVDVTLEGRPLKTEANNMTSDQSIPFFIESSDLLRIFTIFHHPALVFSISISSTNPLAHKDIAFWFSHLRQTVR